MREDILKVYISRWEGINDNSGAIGLGFGICYSEGEYEVNFSKEAIPDKIIHTLPTLNNYLDPSPEELQYLEIILGSEMLKLYQRAVTAVNNLIED